MSEVPQVSCLNFRNMSKSTDNRTCKSMPSINYGIILDTGYDSKRFTMTAGSLVPDCLHLGFHYFRYQFRMISRGSILEALESSLKPFPIGKSFCLTMNKQ